MRETISALKMFAKFPFALRRYLRCRLTADEAERIVLDRMKQRDENLLSWVERGIYNFPRSPYLPLLKSVRCEMNDLRELVRRNGLESALSKLRAEGVYVTYEEFKGRKPIVRNGATIPVHASDFDSPFARRDFASETGGSTGLATAVGIGLDYFAARAPYQTLFLSVHDLVNAPTAYWLPILPGSGLQFILQRTDLKEPIHQWFSSSGWLDSKHWLKYGVATIYILLWLRLLGARVRGPEIVKLDHALQIANWIRDQLKAHSRCLLHTTPSQALRVAVAAQEAGIDLTGALARIGGEPVTPAKVATMQRVGLRVTPGYGMTETSTIALGCLHPAAADDYHLLKDAFALITFPFVLEAPGVTVPAFNLTTLLDNAPKLMLNVQIDDYGVVEERPCGCGFERLGYSTHLSEIHSYSKLVGEGVTLIGNEMIRILEDILPSRFGGSPLDYQLMEQEDSQGFTRLYLIVHPRVQIADERAVIDVVLQGLSRSSPMADAARTVWQQAQTIQIKRQEPVWTAAGKLMPLHIQRSARTQ
jgi:hypothetical protein